MSLSSQPPSSAVPKSLSDNDATNLEKIAALRGYAGHLQAAMRSAISLCREGCDFTAADVLSRALETPVPEDGT